MTNRITLKKETNWTGIFVEYGDEYRFFDITIIDTPSRHGLMVLNANKEAFIELESRENVVVEMDVNCQDLIVKIAVTFGDTVNVICWTVK